MIRGNAAARAMARRATVMRSSDFVTMPRRYHSPLFAVTAPSLGAASPRSSSPARDDPGGVENSAGVRLGGSGRGPVVDGGRRTGARHFNFASSQYASCFEDMPTPDVDGLRRDAVAYLDSFDERSWYDDPVCSILNGEKLLAPPSDLCITKNSLSQRNGHQHHATPSQIRSLVRHIRSYRSPYLDLRPQLRRVEQKLLTEHAGMLIGNQCLDFAKQDGVTEMEESVTANSVERKLNDALFREEERGRVVVTRKPIFVSCVSNFTNFLDLFRKTLRSMELGVPCVILGRSHTVQHSYRWAALLADLIEEEGVDPGILTYLSCRLEDIEHVTASCAESAGMLYTTCSRELARSIKRNYPNTVSSTGGPNTMVAADWTAGVRDAMRTSASIECAGQCTALRHAVVPASVRPGDVAAAFDGLTHATGPADALRDGSFDGVFEGHGGASPPPSTGDGGYTKHATKDAYFRVGPALPSPENDEMEEHWRRVVVDVTAALPPADGEGLDAEVAKLSGWLLRHQPISLAVNATRSRSFRLGRDLFERTSLVVVTVGSTDDDAPPPAATCQARPQDAECFGEFPPRRTMGEHTRFPVIIPSSTPSYDASYRRSYLESLGAENLDGTPGRSPPAYVRDWVSDVSDGAARGYCVELVRYLSDATGENPKRGFGTGRTALWGLQRPPMRGVRRTLLRCGPDVSFDDVSPAFLLFHATNARSQVELWVDESNGALLDRLGKHNLDDHAFRVVVGGEEALGRRLEEEGGEFYNVVNVEPSELDEDDGPRKKFPMPGQFVSLYLPMGHVKSTMKNDEEFVKYFSESEKWLKMAC